jgi:hypothetical protein
MRKYSKIQGDPALNTRGRNRLQLLGAATENRSVGGSIPSLATSFPNECAVPIAHHHCGASTVPASFTTRARRSFSLTTS